MKQNVREAYLTIDDSPSERMEDLVGFLEARKVPALFFVRGDALERNPAPVIRAIQKGFLIGNHTYSHRRASELSLAEVQEDIARCEALIERAYRAAGCIQPHKTFRFSYLDRGAGAWVLDFDSFAAEDRKTLQSIFWEGLNFCDQRKPAPEAFEKQAALQDFLKVQGYSVPFKNVTLDWCQTARVNEAADCFFTYSTNDWMVTARHLEKNWPCKTLGDLQRRMDADRWLKETSSRHVVLAHDQAELFSPVCGLVDYFLAQGFSFVDF